MTMLPDDVTLMRHADGLLTTAEAEAVDRAAAADPALAARLHALRESRRQVAQAFAATPQPTPPEALIARIRALEAGAIPRPDLPPQQETARVVPFPVRRPIVAAPFALAAAVAALALGIGGGYWLGARTAAPAGWESLAILDDPDLPAALTRVASGTREALPSGAELAPVASFRNGDGQLCREFEYDPAQGGSVVAVACHGSATWDLQLAIAAGGAPGDYAPASSLDTLDAWLSATGAGAPLSGQEEAAALAAGGD